MCIHSKCWCTARCWLEQRHKCRTLHAVSPASWSRPLNKHLRPATNARRATASTAERRGWVWKAILTRRNTWRTNLPSISGLEIVEKKNGDRSRTTSCLNTTNGRLCVSLEITSHSVKSLRTGFAFLGIGSTSHLLFHFQVVFLTLTCS